MYYAARLRTAADGKGLPSRQQQGDGQRHEIVRLEVTESLMARLADSSLFFCLHFVAVMVLKFKHGINFSDISVLLLIQCVLTCLRTVQVVKHSMRQLL
jgi:hypothetical protein